VEAGFRVEGVRETELPVRLVDAVVERGEVEGFADLVCDALELFRGGVARRDGEELLADIEVEALSSGEIDFEGAGFEGEFANSFEAIVLSKSNVV